MKAMYMQIYLCLLCCRITARGPLACRYTVDYAMVYIASTNGFIKKAIERGIEAHALSCIAQLYKYRSVHTHLYAGM